MKLHILSDLHTEFRPFTPCAPADTDVVVLAGDIATRGRAGAWASENFTQPIVLVSGNHDSYQTSIQSAHRQIRRDAKPHLHFLENEVFVYQGVRFLGCAGWTDFRATGNAPLAMLEAQAVMNDYKMIRIEPSFRRLRPNDTRTIAEASKQWLLEELQKPFAGKTIVVTHMPPLLALLADERAHGHLDAAYANNWLEIYDLKIDLWIFGHTHYPCNKQLGGIHFLSNPRGYPGEELSFQPDLLITI